MKKVRRFKLSAVLGVTTRVLCGPMGDVADVICFMAQDTTLHSFQFARVADVITPYIQQQHPWLRAVNPDALKGAGYLSVVPALEAQHGKLLTLVAAPVGVHTPRNPLEEIREKFEGDAS